MFKLVRELSSDSKLYYKTCHFRREGLEVKSCVLFLILSFFSELISSSTRTEIGLVYIISETTTSSLVSLTFQGQANTCKWQIVCSTLNTKGKFFFPFSFLWEMVALF